MKNEIDELLNEVRLFHNHIVQVGEALHADESVTLGMRAVLEFLLKGGPMTVPDMARNRSVTRQHIQVIVNTLLDEKLITLKVNPAHKRSSLVALTPEGRQTIQRMRQREGRLFDRTDFGITGNQLRTARRTLEKVRVALNVKEP